MQLDWDGGLFPAASGLFHHWSGVCVFQGESSGANHHVGKGSEVMQGGHVFIVF